MSRKTLGSPVSPSLLGGSARVYLVRRARCGAALITFRWRCGVLLNVLAWAALRAAIRAREAEQLAEPPGEAMCERSLFGSQLCRWRLLAWCHNWT